VGANDTLCRNAVQVADPPQHGSVQLAPDGSLSYQAPAGYSGTDIFSYRIIDATAGQPAGRTESATVEATTAFATVTLNVIAAVDPSSTTTPTTEGTTAPTSSSVAAAPPSTPTVLPVTGARTASTLTMAAVLTPLGVFLVLVARRRRRGLV
jgi:hypothetical protein